eukprot:gene11371-13224_t
MKNRNIEGGSLNGWIIIESLQDSSSWHCIKKPQSTNASMNTLNEIVKPSVTTEHSSDSTIAPIPFATK